MYLRIGYFYYGSVDIFKGSVHWEGVVLNKGVVERSIEQCGTIARPPHSVVVRDNFL